MGAKMSFFKKKTQGENKTNPDCRQTKKCSHTSFVGQAKTDNVP